MRAVVLVEFGDEGGVTTLRESAFLVHQRQHVEGLGGQKVENRLIVGE